MRTRFLTLLLVLAAGVTVAAQVIPPKELTIWSSAARTATANSAEQIHELYRGVALTLHVSARSCGASDCTLDVKLQGFDAVSAQWTDLSGATFQRVTLATGTRTLTVYPAPEGRGTLRTITGTDPAANTEVSETVSVNARWKLYSLTASLVTDANAANREVALTYDDGTTVFARSPSRFNHAASLTRVYSFAPTHRIVTVATDTTQTPPIADVTLAGGFRIQTVTTNRQATDNWGAPTYLVEEWIGNYAAVPLPRIWRAVATIAGTSPSYTFTLAGTLLP